MTDTKTLCACGSGANYADCCEPFHAGSEKAATAEGFNAFTLLRFMCVVKIDYLVGTTLAAVRTTDLWVEL